jgi:signal transduction histidine kinase
MVLACFSADPELSDVCRDSLNALGLDVDVSQSHSVDTFSDGDIEIVEFQSLRLPLSSKAARKWKPRIYLIDREDIDDFLLKVRPPYCAILKPVNEHSLAMALRDAMELASISAGGDPRSETDGLLRLSARAQLLLQVADQDRMRFLGRVAHDLKGPITALSGYCDLLIDDELGRLQPQQSSTVARMQKTVDRLSRMAADILELSVNAEIDRPRPLQLGDIGKVIGHAVREFMPVASAKRLRMVTRVENCPAPIAFDTAGLESVVANLLENAYRFTPAAGLIEVSAYPATRRQKRDWSQASGDAGSAAGVGDLPDHRQSPSGLDLGGKQAGRTVIFVCHSIFESSSTVDAD